MSSCDAFLRSEDGGGGLNGIQNAINNEALPCRFDAVNEDCGGTGEGGLLESAGRRRGEGEDERIRG